MTQRWVSVAEAASRLNVTARTIERRIKRGDVQVRRTDDGRQVLVDLPDQTTDVLSDSLTVITDHDQHQLELASRIGDAYEVPIRRAHEEVERVRQEMKIVRRGASLAWLTAVGIAAVAMSLGWWALKQQGRAALAEKDAQVAAEAASQAHVAVGEFKTMLKAAQDQVAQGESRVDQAIEAEQQRADELRQAVARGHDLELQLANLEAAIERDRLAAAGNMSAVDGESGGGVGVPPDTSTR